MPSINENQLKSQIKSKQYSNIYYFYGNEIFLIELYLSRIISGVTNKSPDIYNYQKFDFKDIDINELIDSIETIPWTYDKKVVTVMNFDAEKLIEKQYDMIEEFLIEPVESTVLIFVSNTTQNEIKKSSKWRNFLKEINKNGAVCEFSHKSNSQLAEFFSDKAKKNNIKITSSAIRYFVQECGPDLKHLQNEFFKLCCYTKSSEITEKDIDIIAIKSFDASVFDLSKAILKKDSTNALKLLNRLFDNGEDPIAVTAVLISAYVDIYRMKIAIINKKEKSNITENFNYKNKEFRLNNAAAYGSKMHINTVKLCLNELYECDKQLKSSKADKKFIMEICLIKLLQY